jgi:predicted nucleic acid-binding protein
MTGEPWLLDTNILIRWVQPNASDFELIATVTQRLRQLNSELCYASQNLGEFWNVLTRPANRNGYGFSPLQTDRKAVGLEAQLRLLPESPSVHVEWRKLLLKHSISGAQVHDARLAAVMLVHGVQKILTFNTRDFARFPEIQAIHPSETEKL